MKKPCFPLLFLLLNLVPLLLVLSGAETFSRSKFPLPPHFVFGSGTSAYQSEGAALEDGRTPSIWDTFAHSGIQPHVTLMHIDFPQALEDEYGGWLSRQMVKDFTAYANVCFREFGDRVLHWTTLNEANIFTIAGYDSGEIPPERCSPPFGGKQHGFIGINVYAYWLVPYTNATEDVIATQRATDFLVGWFVDPCSLIFWVVVDEQGGGTPLTTPIEVKLSLVLTGQRMRRNATLNDMPRV
ncbi:hypothetical protein RHGRI_033533 [Rhododendron griersonianum]|uniref:Uncharacterized protein n=1 Tax=Rhododendron griersonianum TaxID=479676 RepID=A0AAV6I0A2_9ERIC|nr:hypothetical protein RHGRI_033533 [Rhododendron griersonianum]